MIVTKLELKLFVGVLIAVLVVFLLLFNFTEPYTITEGITFSWTKLWVYTSIAYIIFSYRFLDPVGTDQSGAITFFDRPIGNVGAGPVFAPYLLFDVKKVTSLAIQKEMPGEPQDIYRGPLDTKVPLPKGMVPPIRIQFANSIENDDKAKEILRDEYDAVGKNKKVSFSAETSSKSEDGLTKRVTAEPFPVIRFIIKDVSKFLRNIGSVDAALRQIEDEMFSVLTRLYTKMSVAQALQNIDWINIHLFNAVQNRIGGEGTSEPWGITLQDAYVKYIYTSHGVNTAIAEAAQAPFEKQKVIIAAEASKKSKILNGEGDALAAYMLTHKTLDAQTTALKKRAEDLGITGEEAIAQFVAAELAKGDNSIILGSEGLGQLVTLGSTMIKNGGNKK